MPSRPASSPARERRSHTVHSSPRAAANRRGNRAPSTQSPACEERTKDPGLTQPLLTEQPPASTREPCYLAVRLWAVNSFSQIAMKAEVVFRVFMIFRPHGEAQRILPADGSRISEQQSTTALVDALPTLQVRNGKTISTDWEFKRLRDGHLLRDGEQTALPFPQDDSGFSSDVAILTSLITAEITLDFNLRKFPFDSCMLALALFLPKMKDSMYEFVCDPQLLVRSERITPIPQGQGIFQMKPKEELGAALCEWEVLSTAVDGTRCAEDQTMATFRVMLKRLPHFWEMKYVWRPFVISSLACLTCIFNPTEIGNRLDTTLSLLLTLTAINYTASDKLPALPYCTALDDFHAACHSVVLLVIAENTIFHVICLMGTGCPADGGDLLFWTDKLCLLLIGISWAWYYFWFSRRSFS